MRNQKSMAYRVFALVMVVILALLFTFPLYWIITGSFKTGKEINATTPVWWPSEWTLKNYEKLMSKFKVPLWEILMPFGQYFTEDGTAPVIFAGPTVPAAVRWLLNTVWMAVASMLLTCLTAALAGYALAKKRFVGRGLIFTLIVCAMALPKQVILIPLIREMSSLKLYNTMSAVVYPIVGWPFGVFLMKQFAESIPGEIPYWNDYFMQLIMLSSNKNLTISLGIANMQAENQTDFGLIMAGAAFAAVPIIIVFVIFQKYFTKGITMGAVKG